MQLNGLRLDGNFADSPLHTWKYAKNILLSRGFDEIEVEPGNTSIAAITTGTEIGKIQVPNSIIFFVWETNTGIIKKLNDAGNGFTTLLSSTYYNLSPTVNTQIRYIEGVFRYNSKNELIIAWTDGIQPPMIMNCSNPPTISSTADIEKLYLFPHFTHASIDLNRIQTGGSLPSAAYYLSVCYEVEDNINTNFGHISNPIFILKDDVLANYNQFKGNTANEITNKAIIATIGNLDSKYLYFKVAIIKRTESSLECYITKRIQYNSNSTQILISDLDNLALFDIANVLISNPAFDRIGTLTLANKRLRIANVSVPTKISIPNIYDNVINKIGVNWMINAELSLDTAKNSFKDTVFIFNSKGFRSDEVYALYIGFRLKTGGYYGIYHIPGRVAVSTEATATTTVNSDVIKSFKISSVGDTLEGTGDNLYYGKMGYWENDNETYNNAYGTILGNNKVRHHRFPAAKRIETHSGKYIGGGGKAIELDNFELRDTHSYLTEVAPNTWSISFPLAVGNIPLYGTYGNNVIEASYTATTAQLININYSIYAYCTMISAENPSITMRLVKGVPELYEGDIIYTRTIIQEEVFTRTGEGIIFNTINKDIYLNSTEKVFLEIEAYSGVVPSAISSMDSSIKVYIGNTTAKTLGLRIAFDYTTIDADIKAELDKYCDGWEILYAKRTTDNMLMLDQSICLSDTNGVRFYGFDSMVKLLNLQPTHIRTEYEIGTNDINVSANIAEVTNYTALVTPVISKISNIKYLPAYNTATDPVNTNKENCYFVTPVSGSFHYKLCNLINIKTDVYLDFSRQELVSTGKIIPLSTTSSATPILFYGGDSFINKSSFITFNNLNVPLVYHSPTENILNAGLRYDSHLDIEKFYPYTDITKREGEALEYKYIAPMIAAGIANYYIYADFCHLLNNLRQDNINTPATSLTSVIDDTIFSSIPQPDSDISTHWRIFKPLDKYILTSSKGGIYKLIGSDYIVYIQTKYGIFRGIAIDSLKTENISVALKTTDLFERDPEELKDADGEFIQPWDRDGTILTPFGLIVVDLINGRIHQIADKDNQISKIGIEDWFRKTVTTIATFATKETRGTGVILGYDDLYKRLLVTIKNNNTGTISPFTLSFSFEKAAWISFHSYVPDRYAWNANGLYHIIGNTLYKANTGHYGYFMGAYTDSIIDWIFNQNNNERFLLTYVKWTTSVELNGINYWDETINKLMIYSKNLSTGEVVLVKRAISYDINHELQQVGNTLFKDGEWIYNDVKDVLSSPNVAILDNNFNRITASENLLKNWFEKSKFITKFIAVRMIYTNNANKKLRITNVNISAKNIL